VRGQIDRQFYDLVGHSLQDNYGLRLLKPGGSRQFFQMVAGIFSVV
jgi:hypothetical protein